MIEPDPSECWRSVVARTSGRLIQIPICGAPCHYGGRSMAREHSRAELGWMWHCNRRVSAAGQRCWQHSGVVP